MSARRIVIVGAGIAGTGLADELTQRGASDVTVIDRGPLWRTGGATSHAPGLVTRTSGSRMMHLFADYTIGKLLATQLDGLPCYHPVGSIETALTKERMEYLVRRSEFAESWGFAARIISPDEAAALHPLIDPSVLVGAFHTTGEGIGKALRGAEAQGRRAQAAGARIIGDTAVTRILTEGDRVVGVLTTAGPIEADLVVLAAGAWGKGLAATAGVVLPLVAMEHQYAVTTSVPALAPYRDGDASLPFVRHWEGGIYVRDEGDRAGIGSFNHRALMRSDAEMVANCDTADPSKFPLTQAEWSAGWQATVHLMPALRDLDLVDSYNGVFPYSPDGLPIMGESPHVSGLWTLECLWATHSIGAARSLAQAILGEAPEVDFAPADLARFDAPELVRADYEQRCDNAYVDTYAIHHPAEPSTSPRGVRWSPFAAEQERLGGQFFDTSGWERPRWYDANHGLVATVRVPPRDTWSARFWSPVCGAEHLAVRDTAGVFDMTSLRRVVVTGPDAARFLSWMAAKSVDRAIGTVTYTLLLDDAGGITSDVTISRLAADRFLVGGNSQRDFHWLRQHSAGFDVVIEDVTAGTCSLAVWGPAARDLLAPIADGHLDNGAFPYLTACELEVAGVATTAVRVSYVGELGWELSCSAAQGLRLWRAVMQRADAVGAVAAGRGALTSLRIEKGYRAWGVDMSREDTPTEAGLGFASARDGEHRGVAAAQRPARRRLRTLALLDDGTIPTAGQPVRQGGHTIGYTTSAEYGWSVGHGLAYAWLPPSLDTHADVQVACAGTIVPARVTTDVVFDPTGSRVRS